MTSPVNYTTYDQYTSNEDNLLKYITKSASQISTINNNISNLNNAVKSIVAAGGGGGSLNIGGSSNFLVAPQLAQNGVDGKDGKNGTNGINGQPGQPGPPGIDGVAGADGVPGADGATGAQGVTGAQGAIGVTGPTGPSGATGAQGTPYFTQTGPTGFSTNTISLLTNTGPTGMVQGGTGAVYSIYNSTQNGDVGITNNLLVAGATTYPDGSASISNTPSLLYPNSSGNYAFTNVIQVSPPINKSWVSLTMSSNGQYQTAIYNGVGTGNVYYSSNYGTTWTAVSPPLNLNLSRVAMSSSGQFQTVTVFGNGYGGGNIYYSTNYGVSWKSSRSSSISFPSWSTSNFGRWNSVAISSSGQYQVAVDTDSNVGRVWISNNYGITWVIAINSPLTWNGAAISSSGQYVSVTTFISTNIYISKDYGVSFQQSNSAITIWGGVYMSASGQYQCAYNTTDSYIYISKNYGQSWLQSNFIQTGLGAISMSSSGQYVITSGPSNIYYSTNYGMDWFPVFTIANAYGIAMSSSGQYVTLAIFNVGIYTYTIPYPSGLQQITYTIPTIAISANTITLPTNIVFVTGTGPVNNIINPFSSGYSGQITIIPLTTWTTTNVGGNIALGTTAVVSKALIMTYNATNNRWYPSY